MIKAVIFDILNVIFTPIPGEDFSYELKKEMKELIWELNDQGKVLGYLTNGSGKKLNEIISQGILPEFTIKISSVEACFVKPDPGIYSDLMDELNKKKIKPEEAIFIDDRLVNLDPAERLGIRTHHFQDFEKLLGALKE